MREEPAAWHFKDSFLSNDLLSLTESKRVGEVKTCLSAALLKKQFLSKTDTLDYKSVPVKVSLSTTTFTNSYI